METIYKAIFYKKRLSFTQLINTKLNNELKIQVKKNIHYLTSSKIITKYVQFNIYEFLILKIGLAKWKAVILLILLAV